MDAVTKDIDTSAINTWVNSVNESMDTVIAKAKETANALANATKQ